jgi:hypothetical protein
MIAEDEQFDSALVGRSYEHQGRAQLLVDGPVGERRVEVRCRMSIPMGLDSAEFG